MKLEKAKIDFIKKWGTLGIAWGIPRSMAQIHALLLVNKTELSAEEVMEEIKLSRGNVNVNLRELINWGLVKKETRLGERKEFFIADHNIWSLSKSIITERKKRELHPLKEFIVALKNQKLEGDKNDITHFKELINELDEFISQLDQLSDLMLKMNNNIFFKKMIKLIS